jgi:hypothetical protein
MKPLRDLPAKKGRHPLAMAASDSRRIQLTAILRAFPFAFLGSVNESTPLS